MIVFILELLTLLYAAILGDILLVRYEMFASVCCCSLSI